MAAHARHKVVIGREIAVFTESSTIREILYPRNFPGIRHITGKKVCLLRGNISVSYVHRVEEGETIMRTMTDYWVVCRKSGHRRFFVVLQQKSANFAEVNGMVNLI